MAVPEVLPAPAHRAPLSTAAMPTLHQPAAAVVALLPKVIRHYAPIVHHWSAVRRWRTHSLPLLRAWAFFFAFPLHS